ncbi:hypothetical protein CFOL_v3_01933 [Cephalotus follicularis]|uniref:Uncharacterized protein n=1 Tax=Cephalotus follicularis TaxID=3775 RepID=A0A1Q3ARP9_CEPFO|nr:hypothetical protein CFOL_v3_01933 [Cephalotus follicularis]
MKKSKNSHSHISLISPTDTTIGSISFPLLLATLFLLYSHLSPSHGCGRSVRSSGTSTSTHVMPLILVASTTAYVNSRFILSCALRRNFLILASNKTGKLATNEYLCSDSYSHMR